MAQFDEIIAQFEVARESGDLAQAQKLLERALELKPRHTWLWRQMVSVLMNQNQYATALEAINRAEHYVAGGKELAYYHSSRGTCFQHLGRLEESEHYFRLVLEAEEHSYDWNLLGQTLWFAQRDSEATECYRKALQLDPNDEESLLLLAVTLDWRHEDAAESELLLRRAIAIDPNYARAWSFLGQLLIHKHRQTRVGETLQEARRTLQRALHLEPTDSWARIYFANALWTCEELEDAEENYRRAYQEAADADLRVTAGVFLADFLSAEGIDNDFAEQLLRAAVAYEPENEINNYFLGKHLYRCERDAEARPFLQFAAEHGHKRAAKLLRELKAE